MSGTLKPSLGGGLLCLCLLLAAAFSAEVCDKAKCKGPIKFYDDLRCKPIYEKDGAGDCCPVRYDCSHLSVRSANKCYANGNEYAIGDRLKDEDRTSPCDIGCTCSEGYSNVASFFCAAVDCFRRLTPGCYFKQTEDSCCGGEEICGDAKEGEITCEVDGNVYRDGEQFYPNGTNNLQCRCQEGYKGENVEPYCKTIGCGTELRHSADIQQNCIPVFYNGQTPSTSCSYSYRCQNNADLVVHADQQRSSEPKTENSQTKEEKEQMMCKFGNLTLHIGDELNQATDYSSVCVKCICELPPTPTCQRLPDEECDVTVHPPFHK